MVDSGVKIDEIPLPAPVSHAEAIERLYGKSVLICPDANVFLHMVTFKGMSDLYNDDPPHLTKGVDYDLKHLNDWLLQMQSCRELLGERNIGWIIPEQILREIGHHIENKNFSHIRTMRDSLVIPGKRLQKSSQKDILYSGMQDVWSKVIEMADGLLEIAKENRNLIVKRLITLQENEEEGYAQDAWKLVHSYIPPNKKSQQMKDTVILHHLYAFYVSWISNQIDPVSRKENTCFLWTADKDILALQGSKFYPRVVDANEVSPLHIKIFGDVTDAKQQITNLLSKIRASKSQRNMLNRQV